MMPSEAGSATPTRPPRWLPTVTLGKVVSLAATRPGSSATASAVRGVRAAHGRDAGAAGSMRISWPVFGSRKTSPTRSIPAPACPVPSAGALDGAALCPRASRPDQGALGVGGYRGQQAAGEHQHYVHQVDEAGAGVFVPVVEAGIKAGYRRSRRCGRRLAFIGALHAFEQLLVPAAAQLAHHQAADTGHEAQHGGVEGHGDGAGQLGRVALAQGGEARPEGDDGGHQAQHGRNAGEQVGPLQPVAGDALDEPQVAPGGEAAQAPQALAQGEAGFGEGDGAGGDQGQQGRGEQPGDGCQPAQEGGVVHRDFTRLGGVEETGKRRGSSPGPAARQRARLIRVSWEWKRWLHRLRAGCR